MIASGGPRLRAEHFEPARVPPEIARFDPGDPPLPVGSPGKVGILELGFERRTDRTELVHRYQKAPLSIMRPLYHDELRADLPYTMVMTAGGGILQGDRQRLDVSVGPAAAAHVGTQAHTRLYRMDHGYATSVVNLDLAADSYLEYLPDPVIPYAGSRFAQQVRVTIDPTATLLIGETVYAGRLSRGERHRYDAYASDVEVVDPSGRPLVVDRVRLVPGAGRLAGLGVLDGHDIVATLLVVTPLLAARALADALHAVVAQGAGDVRAGVSTLPGDVGAWVRLVADDPVAVAAAWQALWATARTVLTGAPPPPSRRY